MSTAYYDSAYLFKLLCPELGTGEVRAHASSLRQICSAAHSRAELLSACHRKIREGYGTRAQLRAVHQQFLLDCRAGGIVLLPLTDTVFERVDRFFLEAAAHIPLRASDAIHLACAAEHGFREVYSNDRHFLAAAPLFGLKALDIIPA